MGGSFPEFQWIFPEFIIPHAQAQLALVGSFMGGQS